MLPRHLQATSMLLRLLAVLALAVTARRVEQDNSGALQAVDTWKNPKVLTLIRRRLLSGRQARQAEKLLESVPNILEAIEAQDALPELAELPEAFQEAGRDFSREESRRIDAWRRKKRREVAAAAAEAVPTGPAAEATGEDEIDDDDEDDPFFDSEEILDDDEALPEHGESLLQGDGEPSQQISREEAVSLVLDAGQLVANDILTAEEFEEEIGDSQVDSRKRHWVRYVQSVSSLLHQDESCMDAENGVEECLEKTEVKAKMALAAPLRFSPPKPVSKCMCQDDSPPLRSPELLEVIGSHKIPRSPVILRQAANIACSKRARHSLAFYHQDCAGYCCADFGARALEIKVQKEEYTMNAVMHTTKAIHETISGAGAVEEQVRQVVNDRAVPNKEKTVLYKLFIVHYHHAALLMKSHGYCMTNPTDLEHCEDPVSMALNIRKVQKMLQTTQQAILVLVSCLKWGSRPLSAEMRLNGVMGVIVNVLKRSLREFVRGGVATRLNQVAAHLGRKVYEYRFSIGLAWLVFMSAQPMMTAITKTGVFTGSATSMSVVAEKLIGNLVFHLGCPILKSPLLLGQLVRWAMANIILTDRFIELAIKPWWLLVQATPVGLAANFVRIVKAVSYDKVAELLELIGSKLRKGDGTQKVHKKTWLEAAREFHLQPAADILYLVLSSWLGGIWRLLANSFCFAAEVGGDVVNSVDLGADIGFKGATTSWRKMTRVLSAGMKQMFGDKTFVEVGKMAKKNAAASVTESLIAAKALQGMHAAASSLHGAGAFLMSNGIEAFTAVMNVFGTVVFGSYGISGLFSWFFSEKFHSKDVAHLPSDNLIELTLDADQKDFNEHTCQGKHPFADCMYLRVASIDKQDEEVLQGHCCNYKCQAKDAECIVLTEEEHNKLDEFEPEATAISTVKMQSEYLTKFVQMTQTSLGPDCSTPRP
eukprot:TRINITY_DN31180_c0_g1_i1.p1 TRINITY_DN31180_c0_g1~~TRINITY_DN31180_c0_g1_i1.p1  ORF type:complete len:935 (+),score=208.61 TRINITY_DN31180_c0_g1_i1:53-2857(+)